MTFHYIITMTFGATQYGVDSTYNTRPGETRAHAYQAILADTKQRAAGLGIDTSYSATLFFSFEPNDLTAVAE